MSIDKDIEIVKQQEAELIFEKFNETAAVELGNVAIERAAKANQPVTVVVRLGGSPVFVQAMPGTAPANFYWANRKANLVELYGQSSYQLGLNSKKSGDDLVAVAGLNANDYSAHGGCFPIRVQNVGLIGSITVSGLPQREDHILVSNAIATYLKVKIAQLD